MGIGRGMDLPSPQKVSILMARPAASGKHPFPRAVPAGPTVKAGKMLNQWQSCPESIQ